MSMDNDILVVDDDLSSLQLLTELLEREEYRVRPVEKAQVALDSALAKPPGLILLDVRMPEMDGFELCRRLKQDMRTANVPIIFISALDDSVAKETGLKEGGVDYISKPFEEAEVLARIQTHLNLHQFQLNLEQLAEEQTLKAIENEARFSYVIENANEAIIITQDEAVKFCNPKITELIGYSPKEMYSLSFDDFIHPEDLETVLSEYRSRLSGEKPKSSYRIRMLNKSGLERDVLVNSAMINWEDKPAALAMITDITELIQTQKELINSEQRFRYLVEQSPIPLEVLSLDGKISQSNSAWRKLWNVDEATASEVMGKYNMRTDPQLETLGINHLVEKAFSGEHVILPPIIYNAYETVTDFDIQKLEGLKSPWIQCHLYPIKNQNGELVNIVNTYVDITGLKNSEEELRNALKEIEGLKDRLEAESVYLRDEIKLEHNFESIIGNSAALKYTLNRVEQVAPTDSPVLIMGETGTGKELIARALHELSQRSKRALVKVNCAALPADLIESELFGREKGAFTGAATAQAGRFEVADGSTLFLDEIGELPVELQAKLLRVLDSGEFERLGSTRTRHSNARIIAATNRELEEEVRENRFREDLWFRLKVFPITVPPLRERLDDLPLLARFFIDVYSKQMGKPSGDITIRTMKMMQHYHWPGNVRELKHAIEGACITALGRNLQIDLPKAKDQLSTEFQPLEDLERDYIVRVLEARNWKIGGANSAASTLGMHVNTLRGRMKKLGIKKI